MTQEWQGDLLDLDAYLHRIGYEGDRSPTLGTLRGLQRAHVTSVPFENLEIYLGRPIPLGVEALQEKMVRHRRGGYCFEHTELFAAALERLGFAFTALTARVQLGEEKLRSGTHALLRVEADGELWICDVGFGSGPLEPVPFTDGVEVKQGGWEYRLERLTPALGGLPGVEEWAMREREPTRDGWVLRHRFAIVPSFHVDYELANYYVSHSERSPFTGRAYAQRYAPHAYHRLDGTTLTITRADGRPDPVETRTLEPGEVPKVLSDVFGIDLDGTDADRLVAGLSNDASKD